VRWFTDRKRKEVVYGQNLTAATLTVARHQAEEKLFPQDCIRGSHAGGRWLFVANQSRSQIPNKTVGDLSGNCLLQKLNKNTLPNSDVVEEEQSQTWSVHCKVVEHLPPWWYECAVTLAVQLSDHRSIDIGG
jgi:hypothetical protein